jgi:hydrogenase maturation protease
VTAPILIFGWGNPSRGDDAVGPLFVERIEALGLPGVECLTDFQLQVEHALDLQDRQRVLFVDASLDADTPFTVTAIEPRKDTSFTTHTISPQSVLQVYCDLTEEQAPPTWLLAVRGERFELGEPLSVAAESRLAAAIDWLHNWLANPAGTPL